MASKQLKIDRRDWTNELQNEQVCSTEWKNEHKSEQMNRRMIEWTNEWTNKRMNEETSFIVDRLVGCPTDLLITDITD